VFVDPRRSQIDIVQAVGRAMRKSPDKTLGIIVIPVFIPAGADDEEILDSSDFQKVWSVVRALRAHDNVLAEQLDDARFRLGRRGGPTELPGKIVLDLPGTISPSFAEALSARVVEGSTSSWEFAFGLLTRYAEERGTASMQHDAVIDGFPLGTWCMNQRAQCRLGKLSADRVSRLESLPGWAWDVLDAAWERYYELLKIFVERERTSWVPRNHVEEGESLGRWVRRQRQIYKGIVAGNLTKDQRDRLVALPGWAWDLNSEKWERGFRTLGLFYEREGHIRVPKGHVESGVNLTAWVDRQQIHYRLGRLQRQGNHVARLEGVPDWKWWEAVPDRWERNYDALVKFQKREGHVQVPTGHVEGGVTLWRWVGNQQTTYASGKMARYPDRIKRLEAVPGWRWRAPRGPQPQAPRSSARPTPVQDRAVKALEHAGRAMTPSALRNFILAEGLDNPPPSSDSLGAHLRTAARAGRIGKADGRYAPLSYDTRPN
jgi:hypothetical protein